MPVVPLVEQDIKTKALGAPVLGNSIRPVSDPYIENKGMTNLALAVGKVAQQYKDRGDEVALMDAQRKLDDWESQNVFNPDTGYLAKRGKDAFDGPTQLGQQWDNDIQQINDSLGNGDQQLAFQKAAISRRDNLMRTLYSHERSQMDAYADSTAVTAKESAINRGALNWNNPEVVDSSIAAAKAIAVADGRRKGLPDEAIVNDLLDTESKARLAVLTRMADADPKAAIDYYNSHQAVMTGQDLLSAQRLIAPTERKYKAVNVAKEVLASSAPKIERDGVIDYVMNDLEGGEKTVMDSNGALAKYGINAKYNADLFANGATPTAEQAKQRYVEGYWNKIDADNLPQDMRLAAMAFAATAGPDQANKLIDQAGNDPRKLIELQRQFYQGLATKNPDKYAGQLEGWMNRLGKVSAQVDLMRGQIANEAEMNAKIDAQTDDIQVASAAKEIVSKQIEDVKKARKDAEEAASTEAWKYKQQGMEVPVSVIARMNPKDQEQMQNSSPDPTVYEDLRQKIIIGEDVDLAAHRWQLGKKYDDLVELKTNATKRGEASIIDSTVKSSLPAILGKSSIKTEKDYKTADTFRRALTRELVELTRRTGKPATVNDVQAINDRLLMTVDPDGWGTDKPLYMVAPNVKYEVPGIPGDRRYLVAGQEINAVDVSKKIAQYLSAARLPVNEDNISDTYKKLVRQKAIVEKYNE